MGALRQAESAAFSARKRAWRLPGGSPRQASGEKPGGPGKAPGGDPRPWLVAGVMSGTSGDGVTVALVDVFPREPDWPALSLRAHLTVPYDPAFKSRLFSLFDPQTARLDEVCRLNVALAEKFAEAVEACARQAGLSLSDLDLIGSHGQTICHLPPQAERKVAGGVPSTLQIGDVSVLAERTGVTAVGNFRLRDMAAGGEGAPLVPICDWLLFRSPGKTRIVQNIGGIANMTVLPKGAGLEEVFACDTGPGNMLIDEAVRSITQGLEEFDRDGQRAKRGKVDHELVAMWLQDPFFHAPPPKSTGRELFGRQHAPRYFAEARARGIEGDDLVATVTELTVQSILLHYRREVIPRYGLDEVIIGGGGARNATLVERLSQGLAGVKVSTHEAYGIPSEAKEAMAFALLAYLTVTGRPGNVPKATGAKKPVVLGAVAPGS